MIKRIVFAVLRRLVLVVGCFAPIKNNKIVFSSYYGRDYGDNPKYIVEELLRNSKDLQIIWLLQNDKETKNMPKGVVPIKTGSIAAIYHLATARAWVDNCRKSFPYKKKKQYYIQTWHGFALKRIEADVQEHLGKDYVRNAKRDSKRTDLIISEADFMTKIYQTAFWYDGPVVKWGSPRNDILLDTQKRKACKERVAQYFNLDPCFKIVMYAPTFRANRSLEPYCLDYNKLKEICQTRFGGEFKVLIRLHPTVMEKNTELKYDGCNIINASPYPDMQELLAASDVVISDYSSLMFDFALSQKPCFQFATDIEAYKEDRNFYFQLDALPFSVSKDNDELMEHIISFNEKQYQEKLEDFFSSVGMERSGNASLKCAQLIADICCGKKVDNKEIGAIV